MINLKSKIFVAGHNGLVGSAIVRKLKDNGYKKILTVKKSQLDLTDQKKVLQFLKKHKPDFIFIAAAKVGGIYSNQFVYSNKYYSFCIFSWCPRFNLSWFKLCLSKNV